jgi:hypothetical protein
MMRMCGGLILAVLTCAAHAEVERPSLTPGQWWRVPDSKLAAVVPDPVPSGDNRAGTPESIMVEWSSGALDTQRNRLIVWGGGHNNYSGNELYVFDLNTLRWQRLTEPSRDVGGVESSGYYPDGQPRSRHTYDYIEYVPVIDRFCSFGGAAQFPAQDVHETANVDCFDFDANRWETRAYRPIPKSSRYESSINSISAYDPVQRLLYLHTTRTGDDPRLWRWHPGPPGKDRWELLTGYDWIGGNLNAEIDPGRRLMVAVGEGQLYAWDLRRPFGGAYSPKVEGDVEIQKVSAPGLAYEPHWETLIAWGGGGDVFALVPAPKGPWRWRRCAPEKVDEAVPGPAPDTGTYGRFRYSAAAEALVAVTGIHEDVRLYRLSDAQRQHCLGERAAGSRASLP